MLSSTQRLRPGICRALSECRTHEAMWRLARAMYTRDRVQFAAGMALISGVSLTMVYALYLSGITSQQLVLASIFALVIPWQAAKWLAPRCRGWFRTYCDELARTTGPETLYVKLWCLDRRRNRRVAELKEACIQELKRMRGDAPSHHSAGCCPLIERLIRSRQVDTEFSLAGLEFMMTHSAAAASRLLSEIVNRQGAFSSVNSALGAAAAGMKSTVDAQLKGLETQKTLLRSSEVSDDTLLLPTTADDSTLLRSASGEDRIRS
jgi:hypothetical protein